MTELGAHMDKMDFRSFMLNPAAAAAARQLMAQHLPPSSAAPYVQQPPSAATGTPPGESGCTGLLSSSPSLRDVEGSDMRMKHSPEMSDSESDTSLSNTRERSNTTISTTGSSSSAQPSAALGAPSASTSLDHLATTPGVSPPLCMPPGGAPTSVAAAAMLGLAAAGMQSGFPVGMGARPSLPVFPGQPSPFSPPSGPVPAAAETPSVAAVNAAALSATNPMAAAMLGKTVSLFLTIYVRTFVITRAVAYLM